jgi:hypothetical protein
MFSIFRFPTPAGTLLPCGSTVLGHCLPPLHFGGSTPGLCHFGTLLFSLSLAFSGYLCFCSSCLFEVLFYSIYFFSAYLS